MSFPHEDIWIRTMAVSPEMKRMEQTQSNSENRSDRSQSSHGHQLVPLQDAFHQAAWLSQTFRGFPLPGE